MPADCASLVYSSKIEVYQNRIDNFIYFLKKKKISKAISKNLHVGSMTMIMISSNCDAILKINCSNFLAN